MINIIKKNKSTTFVILALIVTIILWLILTEIKSHLKEQTHSQYELHTWLTKNANTLVTLRNQKRFHGLDEYSVESLNDSLKKFGLMTYIKKLNEFNNGYILEFQAVPFQIFIGWFYKTLVLSNLTIKEMNISKSEKTGFADIKIVFSEAKLDN